MKKFNFLSNLWSLIVGSRKDDGSTRLRVDYDSFTCRLRVWTLKLVSVLVIVLSLGIGNAWGADVVYKTAKFGSAATTSTSILPTMNRPTSVATRLSSARWMPTATTNTALTATSWRCGPATAGTSSPS